MNAGDETISVAGRVERKRFSGRLLYKRPEKLTQVQIVP